MSDQAPVASVSDEQAQDDELCAAMGPDILSTNQTAVYLNLLKVGSAVQHVYLNLLKLGSAVQHMPL